MQAAIEELETSNEELQATNEELLAANEELQSTNEELQSVNEELVTVNSEYQYKIEELIDVNNDIDNLLSSVHVGTLFLDQELRIKRFTSDISEEIYLMDFDIGRPIQHISHNLKHSDLISDIKHVLETQENLQQEVESYSHKWYLLRIIPYFTLESLVEGVVITLLDISEKRKEQERQMFLAAVTDVMDDAVIGKNQVGDIISWNHGAERLLGYQENEIIGRDGHLLIPDDLTAESDALFAKVRDGERVEKYKTIRRHQNGTLIPVSLSLLPIYNQNQQFVGVSKILHDMRDTEYLNDDLHQSQLLNLQLINHLPLAAFCTTTNGEIMLINQQAEQRFGEKVQDLCPVDATQWQLFDAEHQPLSQEVMPLQRLSTTQQDFTQQSFYFQTANGMQQLQINGALLKSDNDKTIGYLFTFNS